MRVVICLVLLALLTSGCRRNYSEAYAWGDDWVVKDPAQADAFWAKLKTKLAAEGLAILPTSPTSWVATNSGEQPQAGDQVYWFQGSYQGSPPFQIKLLRSRSHQEGFHLMYFWALPGYVSPNKEMEEWTRRLHEVLSEWVRKDGRASLPPGSP